MNDKKFLLFNWKHQVDLNLVHLIKNQNPFQIQKDWNFFLLCNYSLWEFFKTDQQFKIIAQNFTKLSFQVYLQAVKSGFYNNYLTGILLNHSEINNSPFEINQLINLANRYAKKICFCIGKMVNFNTSFNVNSKILMREIITLKMQVLNPKKLILIFEPLFFNNQNKMLVQHSKLISRLILFIKRSAKNVFKTEIPVLYGGGVKPSNHFKLPHTDGFIVGRASWNWNQILKWNSKENNA